MVLDPITVFLALVFWPKKKSSAPKPQLVGPGMSVFPVTLAAASFSDDYHAETIPGARKHLGIDIFAPSGTAVLAPEAGAVRFTTDPMGGNVFYLKGASGTNYYGAHLMGAYGADRVVRAGEQLGWVGNTGNAATTAAHLHFQMNGGKTNPYPKLRELASDAPVAPWARGAA